MLIYYSYTIFYYLVICSEGNFKGSVTHDSFADAEKPWCDFNKIVVYDVKRFGRLDSDEAGYYRRTRNTLMCNRPILAFGILTQ